MTQQKETEKNICQEDIWVSRLKILVTPLIIISSVGMIIYFSQIIVNSYIDVKDAVSVLGVVLPIISGIVGTAFGVSVGVEAGGKAGKAEAKEARAETKEAENQITQFQNALPKAQETAIKSFEELAGKDKTEAERILPTKINEINSLFNTLRV